MAQAVVEDGCPFISSNIKLISLSHLFLTLIKSRLLHLMSNSYAKLNALTDSKNLKMTNHPAPTVSRPNFTIFFWSELKTEMISSFQFAFQTGSLSISQRRGVISLIPKKDKDKSTLENLRPISLPNVDYKVLTKVIAKTIEKMLPKIINPDQTGYVKGRYIGENIRLIQDVMLFTKNTKYTWNCNFHRFP